MSTIKITAGGSTDYLAEIPQIQLNGGFQSSLDDAVNKINENFKSLVSLPFLQGDKGNSIFEVPIGFTDVIGTVNVGGLMKSAVCECIYGPGNTTPDDSSFGGSSNFGPSWKPQTYDSTKIVFYRHKETTPSGEKYFYAGREFFIFTDCRLEQLGKDLANVPLSWYTSFVDLSCAVSITATAAADEATGLPDLNTITFSAKKHTIVPTLYYDSNAGYWCWSVNGTKTGVIAQGVKGESGAIRGVFICKGNKVPTPPDYIAVQHSNGIIKIDHIVQPESLSSLSEDKLYTRINTGDLVCVWFEDENLPGASANSDMNNCTFGLAKNHTTTDTVTNVTTGYTYIDNSTPDGIKLDLATQLYETTLYRWLNDINTSENSSDPADNPAIRGLYVPDGDPYGGLTNIHMLWSDGSLSASIGCMGADDRRVIGSSLPLIANNDTITGWNEDTSSLTMWYPTIRCHRRTGHRLIPANYTMAGNITPCDFTSVALKHFGDTTTVGAQYNLARKDGIASAISLRGPIENQVDDETLVSSAGLYIRRKADNANDHYTDIPSLYIDQGRFGKSFVKGGSLTVQNGYLYIGNTAKYNSFPTLFAAKYDGSDTSNSDGGYYTPAIENEVKKKRWEFLVPSGNTPSYVKNTGLKLTNSDAIFHGGTVAVSSDNSLKSIFVQGNKLMFDYKVHAEIGDKVGTPSGHATSVDNSTAVHDRRPRTPAYVGIQIGGYNTIYNSITSNSQSGKTNSILTNICEPIELSPEQNKEYAFLSGKYGYTSMIENWGLNNIRKVDPPTVLQNDYSIAPDDGNWGMLTSYNCLWTKVGNVVDVKGKIFLNKAKYTVDSNGLNVDYSNVKPLTYAEIFRHIKRYGMEWGFPLPIVLKKASGEYVVSTGNALDNPSGTGLVNFGQVQVSTSSTYPRPNLSTGNTYHNDLFNGSAQFHFYGTNDEMVTYNSAVDNYGPVAGYNNGSMPNGINLLNNVFTVTADISKTGVYDDRFWVMSGIPNYDVLNYRGSTNTTSDFARLDQFSRMHDSSFAPIRIVIDESDSNGTHTRTDGTVQVPNAPTTSGKYRVKHAILGIANVPGHNFNSGDVTAWRTETDRKPSFFYHKAGTVKSVPDDDQWFAPGLNDASKLGDYMINNYMNNLRSYKISVNIGSYMVRYISFAFSYLLDDDIQTTSTDQGVITRQVERVDEDTWYLPNGNSSNSLLISPNISGSISSQIPRPDLTLSNE